MDKTHFSGFLISNSRHFTTLQPEGLFLSHFFFETSHSNVCEICWFTEDCSIAVGIYESTPQPRNIPSKTEVGKKNSEKEFKESETFSGSKFDPATGVIGSRCWASQF